MELLLKKTKITKNIIDQLSYISIKKFLTCEVIGWFKYVKGKTNKKIILCIDSDNQPYLFRTWSPDEISVTEDMVQIDQHGTREKKFYIFMNSNYWYLQYKEEDTKENCELMLEQLHTKYKEVLEKGQFFI